jgi:tryptophan-rich sensory protein
MENKAQILPDFEWKKKNKQTNKQKNYQIFQQLAKNIQWSPFFFKEKLSYPVWSKIWLNIVFFPGYGHSAYITELAQKKQGR